MRRAPGFLGECFAVVERFHSYDGLLEIARRGFLWRKTTKKSFASRISCRAAPAEGNDVRLSSGKAACSSVAPPSSTGIRGSIHTYCETVLVALAMLAQPGSAQPLNVRHQAGSMHGFLVLRNGAGAILASGEMTQVAHGDRIKLRIVFRFRDGSIDDETTVYSQRGSFLLISDRLLQRGPSFPHPSDIMIDVRGQQLSVRDLSKGGEAATTEHLDLPPDLSNGLLYTLTQNLAADTPKTEVSFLAVSPKPRLVKLAIAAQGEDPFTAGGHSYKAVRYVVKVELGGVEGVVAPMIGKQPADSHIWVAGGSIPAVVRVDTTLYPEGPIWSIQLASPSW
jgi:hypothetical protein